jgi:hypothetical protein
MAATADQSALDRLTPLVYAEHHRIARRHMSTELEKTLQTTALMHGACLGGREGSRMQSPDAFLRSLSPDYAPHSGAAGARVSAKRGRDAGHAHKYTFGELLCEARKELDEQYERAKRTGKDDHGNSFT